MRPSPYRPGNGAPSAAGPSSAAADSLLERIAAGTAAVDTVVAGIAVANTVVVGTAVADIEYTGLMAHSSAGFRADCHNSRRNARQGHSGYRILYKGRARPAHWRAYHVHSLCKTL